MPRDVTAPNARAAAVGAAISAWRAERDKALEHLEKVALVEVDTLEHLEKRERLKARGEELLQVAESRLRALERHYLMLVTPKTVIECIKLDREITLLTLTSQPRSCERRRAKRRVRRNVRARCATRRGPPREPDEPSDLLRLCSWGTA